MGLTWWIAGANGRECGEPGKQGRRSCQGIFRQWDYVHSVRSASAARGYRLILASLLRRKGAVAGSQASWEQDQPVWWAAIIRVSLAKCPSSPGFPRGGTKG